MTGYWNYRHFNMVGKPLQDKSILKHRNVPHGEVMLQGKKTKFKICGNNNHMMVMGSSGKPSIIGLNADTQMFKKTKRGRQ